MLEGVDTATEYTSGCTNPNADNYDINGKHR